MELTDIQMNSRGNRKRGEFKENLSEVTLSQTLREIQEKVHRLRSDAKDIKKRKSFSYIYASNDHTSALPERDDIVRAA